MPRYRVKATMRRSTEERLRRLARAGEVFLDGDLFRAAFIMPETNTGDQYRVEPEPFIAIKRTLLKLKRLEHGDVGVVAWRPFGEQADLCLPVDTHPLPVRPGNHPISPAMAEAFNGRIAIQEREMHGFPLLAACAPIRDSLDDVVGVVELFASLVPDRFRVDAFHGTTETEAVRMATAPRAILSPTMPGAIPTPSPTSSSTPAT